MRQVTIFSSDLTGQDLVVVQEDGSKIENISELTIHMAPNTVATVELTLDAPVVNVKGYLHNIEARMPCCGETIHHECDAL